MPTYRLHPAVLRPFPATEPFHSWSLPDGRPWTEFYRTEGGFLLRFPGLADFEIVKDGSKISAFPCPGVASATIEHLHLNQVLPLALSAAGKLVFHASAVVVAETAIAFAGVSGRGKSTLAAAFSANGHAFLSDDGLQLEQQGEQFLALPSHPSIRLWDDSHDIVQNCGAAMAAPVEYTNKARFLAGGNIVHCERSKPLRAAYFLGDDGARSISIRRLGAAEAFVEWTKHSFLLDVGDPGLLSGQFKGVAMLTERISCFTLDYPRNYGTLPDLRQAIVKHALKIPAPHEAQ